MSVDAGRVGIEKRAFMVVNREFLPTLTAAGLTDFDRVFHFEGGKIVKRIRARSVTRLDIPGNSKPLVLYLKRHVAARPTLTELVAGWWYGRSLSPGMAEFENICEFRAHGMATPAPVAAGQRRITPFCYESFLITESVAPFISLEAIIRHHPEHLEGRRGAHRKKSILAAIGRLARAMHDKGLNHRDFNATHVLIGPETDDGSRVLALFDLQRVDRKRWMRFRWMIKTMAELIYSMPGPLFSGRDHRFLFESYTGRSSRGIKTRIMRWWINRKVGRIARHTEKIMRRREKMRPEEREIRPH